MSKKSLFRKTGPKKRGGARPGAGRPTVDKNNKKTEAVVVMFSPREIAFYTAFFQGKRSAFIRAAVLEKIERDFFNNQRIKGL